jgi:hypothetical protein
METYRAEDMALSLLGVTLERDEIEPYVSWVWMVATRVFDLTAGYPPEVQFIDGLEDDGRGTPARSFGGTITLPRWSRRTHIILHEIAHSIAGIKHGYFAAPHGREYCSILLRLVLHIMGRGAYAMLIKAFNEQGVQYESVDG